MNEMPVNIRDIKIRDVPVSFPFKPYELQEDFMSKVIECLQKGVNGVLESPTGTGKTLSLLCSSLAWLQLKKAQVLQSELNKSNATKESGESSRGDNRSRTKIIYASRTHSQLAQAMKELKRTSYRHMKSAVLGSRDQLCLHPDLAGENGSMKVAMCRKKISARSCHYYNNLESRKHDQNNFPTEVTDIEDLVKFGNETQCCPYYMSREMMSSADIVFMPYNYLLHAQTRRQQQLILDNTVVILDEAHNVERMCEESASVQITSTDIALCIAEVEQIIEKIKQDLTDLTDDSPKAFSLEDLRGLKAMFLSLENAVDAVEFETVKYGKDKGQKMGKTFPASYIFELLAKAGITADKLSLLDTSLSNLALFLTTTCDPALTRKGEIFLKFNEFLATVFSSFDEGGPVRSSDRYYRVYIEPEVPKKGNCDAWSDTKTVPNSTAKVVNFWCFSPGFTMRSLLKQGVKSVILTSGTLSPTNVTIAELGIPIPVYLENPHIIKPSQVCINALRKGPTGVQLISDFANRENPNYMAELGRILHKMCGVVPDGILMFFNSFSLMHKTTDHWRETGLWSQINVEKKIFVEPQKRESLAEVMKNYSESLEMEGSGGAVLLAVLRGKVSEGMDFADSQCRAVIITGLPYPPFRDLRVVLKREYMKNMQKKMALSEHQWYMAEGTKAVNQAVGRLIRHRRDFGALLLCDCRFEKESVAKDLSAWMRPLINKSAEFGPVYERVSEFFKDMERTGEDIKTAVCDSCPDKLTDSDVEPAQKKRKLKDQPLEFDSTSSENSDTASTQRPAKSTVEYVREVKSTLEKEEFKIFKEAVKNYGSSNSANYDSLVLNLRKVFSDPSRKDLFIEFKNFIKAEHVSNFDDLCVKLFGSSSL
ncbi:regulator of telomere elongation helicase 1 homolog isoform X2 [Macrosteles quadrilineatus]|uniref:regulator of telomere elongation helicase 1 homolog isoform X2 n=1 Tax=Macrosteles quadrilineatus TaxID=74068 RepID=UPI0023E0BBCF|nr:regulator of telomere elongation helicase 1 homolog isoform X2 [Macrosteles quadrilineatus]